jgi:alpha-glucosidase
MAHPLYPSPMLDFGNDISDFRDVDPSLGSLDVLDRLIEALHEAGIRLILDCVPNHTSDQHPWFLESRASRTGSKRHWYIWAEPGPDGGPPNNWLSRFGNSAWTWDEASRQYYYHSFLSEQPDLNWRSEAVRSAMAEVLRFWMKRGVDGFRVDASAVLSKDALFRDNPPNKGADESTPPPQRLRPIFTDDRPEAMTYLSYLRSIIEEFDERLLCGEVQGKTDRIGHFYGEETPRLHLPLNFALLDSEWAAVSLQAEIDAYMNAIPKVAWPNWVIGGHDKKRIASKVGGAQARVLAMLLLTLRGTPIFFAGDEIGLEQIPIPSNRVVDPFEKLVPGYQLNRDPQRAPMRWSSGPNAGFTTGDPWLPIGPHAETRNVSELQQDSRSLLWLYKKLIEIRNEPALVAGEYVPHAEQERHTALWSRDC